MKVSKHFNLEEIVPMDIFSINGIIPVSYIDEKLLKLLDFMRDFFAMSITINNSFTGGSYNESGLRIPGMKNYKPWSQHSFGRAADIKLKIHSFDVQKTIRENKKLFMSNGLTGIETHTDGWTHVTSANLGTNKLALIPPSGIITYE